MEAAIQFGLPVLIENVEDTLDPSLDPILTKSYYKKVRIIIIMIFTLIQNVPNLCWLVH